MSEVEKVLSVKDDTCTQLTALFGRFGLGNLLRRLSLEKQFGLSAATLIMALCLFRINKTSIFRAYHNKYNGLLDAGKNCFYRMLLRPSMDWRRLQIGVVSRFESILRKERVSSSDRPRCFIIDDTTLEKTGFKIEKISRVFDHVSGRYIPGFKLLLLAVSDGISTLPVDFSLHRENGKNGNFGLSKEQSEKQCHITRLADNPDKVRSEECDKKKTIVTIEMLKRAWSHGIRAKYLLADSWFTCEWIISEVRKIGNGAIHFVGLAKLNKTRYKVAGKVHCAHELIALNQREAKKCRKYKCLYVALNGMLGEQNVRIYLIKYGRNENWNILLSSDMRMKFEEAFELYQMRWSIEVLNKECKGYLGLGGFQGRNFNGQIADCTLCFITYTVLALGKRFSDYETMGEIFRAEKTQLLALTLWSRVLSCIKMLLETLAEILGCDVNQIILAILDGGKACDKIMIMLEALRKDDSRNPTVV